MLGKISLLSAYNSGIWPAIRFTGGFVAPPAAQKPRSPNVHFEMQGLTSQFTHPNDTPKVTIAGRRKVCSVDFVAFAGPRQWGRLLVLGLLALLSFSRATAATAPDVILNWKATADTNIGFYQVRYGTAPGTYTKSLNVSYRLLARISGLQAGTTYYFAVCAYSLGGLEGDLSREVVYTTRPPPNSAPDGWISAPGTGGTIYAGQTVSFSGGGYDPDGQSMNYRWSFGAGSGIPDSPAANTGPVRFGIPGTYRVTFNVMDSLGLADSQPASLLIKVLDSATTVVPRDGWKLTFVNSEETNGYAATRSFDGDPSTFWHTKFSSVRLPKPPHEIQIDLGSVRYVNGFDYLPRQDSYSVGNIGAFQFYTSLDGRKWGKAAATGSFSNSPEDKRVNFSSRRAKFIRLVSTSPADGNTDCSVAEINILQGPPPNIPPVSSAVSVSTSKNKAVAIKLKGSDANGNPLTFQIVKAPSSGSLTGAPPNLVYQPKKNFTGKVNFTYRLNDGTANSKVSTVTIQVKKPSATSSAPPQKTLFARSSPKAEPTASTVTSTTVIGGEKFLVLTIAKPAFPDGFSRTVQVSSNLLDWFSGKVHTTVLLNDENFLKVRDNTPIAPGKKRHIRLKTRPH